MSSPGIFPASSSRSRGFAAALLSAALFGAATPVAKDLLGQLPPMVLAGLFYLGAALLLSPAVAWRKLRGGRSSFPADRRNRLLLVGAIVFGGVIGPVLLLLGLQIARAASVSLWLNLETTATAILGVWLFKEHLGRLTWMGNLGVLVAGSHRHDDGHHNHAHPNLPPSHRHSHRHKHERIVHSHPHWPDLHHRHVHGH